MEENKIISLQYGAIIPKEIYCLVGLAINKTFLIFGDSGKRPTAEQECIVQQVERTLKYINFLPSR